MTIKSDFGGNSLIFTPFLESSNDPMVQINMIRDHILDKGPVIMVNEVSHIRRSPEDFDKPNGAAGVRNPNTWLHAVTVNFFI